MSEPPEGDHAELVRTLTTTRERTATQVDALARDLDQIFEASELVSTDDEHDPEGTTIAYERAQVTALLAQARETWMRSTGHWTTSSGPAVSTARAAGSRSRSSDCSRCPPRAPASAARRAERDREECRPTDP